LVPSADELEKIDMFIDAGKCAVLWFGPRFAKSCASVSWQGNALKYCDKAKYYTLVSHCVLDLSFLLMFLA